MKNFRITVNGNVYDVTVEETANMPMYAPIPISMPLMQAPQMPVPAQPVSMPMPAQQAPTAAPAPVAQDASAQTPPAPAASGGKALESPLPGTVLNIMVKVGDKVTKNQPVMILEAMKMENEIVASESGTVASIQVTVGQMIDSGSVLLTIA